MSSSKKFPFSSGLYSHNFIISVTRYCNLVLKRQSFLTTLDRVSLPPARQQGRVVGASSPTCPGEGDLVGKTLRGEDSGPLYKHSREGLCHFQTACQHCWERKEGWSCTGPGEVEATVQKPASSLQTHSYICCCWTSWHDFPRSFTLLPCFVLFCSSQSLQCRLDPYRIDI